MRSWIYMLLAILLEVVATTCMKLSEGLVKPLPSILMFVFYVLCFIMLARALKEIELGVAYAIWSGVGTALTTVIGIVWLNESMNPVKIGAILLIIIAAITLRVVNQPVG